MKLTKMKMFLLIPLIVTFTHPTVSKNTYSLKYENDIPIVIINAESDYEYGFVEGKFFIEYYGENYVKSTIFKFCRLWLKEAKEHMTILEKYYPSFLDRLRGFSEGTGIPLLDLIAFELIFPSIFMGKDACTTAAVSSRQTSDNQPYISWNIDVSYIYKIIFSRYFSPPPIIVCNISGKYKYIKFGVLSSVFGFGLLNEKGLAYSAAMVEVNDTGEGLTSLELNNLAMESCATVDEVESLYKNAERRSGIKKPDTAFGLTSNMNTLWIDANGNALLLEYTHRYFASKKADILAETNHHQLLDSNLTGAPKNNSFINTSSYVRLKRAYELLYNYRGNINIEFFKEIFTRDHNKGFVKGKRDLWDICRHSLNTPSFPWDIFRYSYGTVCALIIQPKEYLAYYCPGHPCLIPFKTLDFSDELK